MIFRDPNFSRLAHNWNLELEKFRCCPEANRLSINLEKTHALVVSNRQYDANASIMIGNRCLLVKNQCTHLGVKFDNNPKLNNHINYITNKVSKTCGFLYKINKVECGLTLLLSLLLRYKI